MPSVIWKKEFYIVNIEFILKSVGKKLAIKGCHICENSDSGHEKIAKSEIVKYLDQKLAPLELLREYEHLFLKYA